MEHLPVCPLVCKLTAFWQKPILKHSHSPSSPTHPSSFSEPTRCTYCTSLHHLQLLVSLKTVGLMETVLSHHLDFLSDSAVGSSSYLSLIGLLKLHFVQFDLFIMLISQILQGLSHFGFILLLATSVHLDQTMFMSFSCFPNFLHTQKEMGTNSHISTSNYIQN